MKEIGSMTTDEMAAEIRSYEYQPDRGYAFISYSHMDRERVYPVVLRWMRAGYNIYIDLDFEKHGSDQHWVAQMSKTLARSACRLAVCFKSIHYTYSYAALLELLTIRSGNTTDRHRGKLLCVDSVTLELVPSDQDDIPTSLDAVYQEYFDRMRLSMGQRFAGQNVMERDTLHEGLDDWLFHMEPETKTRLGYSRISADQLMENIEETYEEGMQEFFPYIARLIKNWFDSQNLNGNDISPQADNRDRFAQVGVDQIREPVTVLAPVELPPPSPMQKDEPVPVPETTYNEAEFPVPEVAVSQPETESPLPSASEPKPESAPVSTTVQKAEDVSVSEQETNPDSQPQAEQVQNLQSMLAVQPPHLSDMKIKDGVLVKYDGPGGDVVIPEGVTEIDELAFDGCKSLTSVTIPEGVTTIGKQAFSRCASLISVTIPDSVMKIGEWAFEHCASLTNVTIPEGVTEIGQCAFLDCASLASVTIPEGVTTIGDFAFSDCASLDSVTIPEGVTTIGDGTFSDCESLDSVTIPEGVTEIGDSAFSGCKSLTSVTIPDSVTEIGDGTFSDCESLDSVTIPEGVTTIGDFAFSDCESLDSVTIPEGVTTIGRGAFSDCASLDSVTIPEGVTTIGDFAFDGCKSLDSVTIPNSVTTIGKNAFTNCSAELEIRTPARSCAHKYAKKHNIRIQRTNSFRWFI